MTQAMEYESWDDPSDRVRRFFNEIGQTHTYAVRRVSEVMKWVQSGEYDRIVRGEYRTRDQEANVREEAGDAIEFYAERFRDDLPRDRRQPHHARLPGRRDGRAGGRLAPQPQRPARRRRLGGSAAHPASGTALSGPESNCVTHANASAAGRTSQPRDGTRTRAGGVVP